MPERLPDGSRTRPVGDLFGPFFRVYFFNLPVEPTQVELTDEEYQRIRSEGLTQQSAATSAVGNLFATSFLLGGFSTVSGLTFAAAATAAATRAQASFNTNQSIERQIPNIAASLSAESKAGSPYRFVLTLTPEYEDALIILNSRLFTYATVAEVEWGYASGAGEPVVSDRHLFRNIYPRADFGENISIIIEGIDIPHDFGKRNNSRKTWRRSEVPTNYDIIRQLVTRVRPYRIDPPTAEAARAIPSLASSDLLKVQSEDVVQNMPDMAFVKSLLRQSGGLDYTIVGTTFKIFNPVKTTADQRVTYTFKWRQALEGELDVPVYSCKCNFLSAYFQPLASRGLVSIGYDDESGEATATRTTPRDVDHSEPVDSNRPSPLLSILTGNEPQTTTTNSDREPVTPNPPADPGSADVIAEVVRRLDGTVDPRTLSVLREDGQLANPAVSLKCPGVPDLFPGRIVRLSGFTDIFDSLYRVQRVKHVVSSSGYDMDVELLRYSAVSGTTGGQSPNTRRHEDSDNTDTETEADRGGLNDDDPPNPVLGALG